MSLRRYERRAIARVEKDGVLEGSAFVVAKKYAITARHVVRDIADLRVDLVFSEPDEKLAAKVVHPVKKKLKEPPDWALLELERETVRRPLPLRTAWQSNAWVSYGFGNFYVEGKPLPGGPLNGQIIGQDGDQLQLQCEQLDDKLATDVKGFSGAPVIASRAVVGIIANSRKNTKTKRVKTVNALGVAKVFENWPLEPGKPDPRPSVFVAALTSALEGKRTKDLVEKLALIGFVSEEDIAECLTELSFAEARSALRNDQLGRDPAIARLIKMLLIHPDAGVRLHAILAGDRPVAAIRTKSEATVRYHLMRAHGVDRDGNMVTWGDSPHMINLIPTGEGLDALIEAGAKAAYKCSREKALQRLEDPDYAPAIFTISDVPSDDEIASATALSTSKKPRIVAYAPEMSPEYLKSRGLTATLIEPFLDTAVEEKLAAADPGMKESQ